MKNIISILSLKLYIDKLIRVDIYLHIMGEKSLISCPACRMIKNIKILNIFQKSFIKSGQDQKLQHLSKREFEYDTLHESKCCGHKTISKIV